MIKKKINLNGEEVNYSYLKNDSETINIKFDNSSQEVKLVNKSNDRIVLALNGKQYAVSISDNGHYVVDGIDFWLEDSSQKRRSATGSEEGQMLSPMPGKILKVMVETGQEVKKGDALLIMEAMKMEHTIKASKDGVVESIDYKVGDQVAGGIELVILT